MNPSLALIPSAYSAGKLYSVLPEDGTGDFNVSRNGTATYFDKNGIIQTAQANEPRLDFDPLTGEFKGVLVEPAATNLNTYSNDFTDGSYTKLRASVVFSSESKINGDNAYILSDDNSGGNSLVRLEKQYNLTAGQTYTYSVFVKKRELNWVHLWINNFDGFSDYRRWFDLENGILGAEVGIGNSSIKSVGDGWYKCTMTWIEGAPNTPTQVYILLADTDLGLVVDLDGTSTIFISGAQLEEGSVATSYIATTDSQVTRPADIIDVNVPAGVTEIKETVDEVENTITSIPATYQLPNGHISRILMI